MNTTQHQLPADAPRPVAQAICGLCGGTGWRESYIDDNGIGHGWTCVHCAGRGYVWIEVEQ